MTRDVLQPASPALIAEALSVLGVERLTLGIHQAAFPAAELDTGCGAPASEAGRRFARFAAELGFDTLQLGPDGQVSLANPSPYDGTAFARSLTSTSPDGLGLATHGLVDDATLASLCEPQPGEAADSLRVDLGRAFRTSAALLSQAYERWRARADDPGLRGLREEFAQFRAEETDWLEQDALFEVLAGRVGHDDPTRFEPAVAALLGDNPAAAARRGSLRATLGADLARAELGQWLAERDARAFRQHARDLGLELFGDLQIGWSSRDRFLRAGAFDPRFRVGAPPSRTNPKGQPWDYPLLAPDQLDDVDSPARRLFDLRLRRALSTYDGLRVDHPHGLVCPWIYESDGPDPVRAVQQGVRAFESPDLDDEALRRWAIATVEDLNLQVERHGEGWVRQASPAQVARWSRLMDVVLERAREAHGGEAALAVEVLSTCPAPLRWVLERHGLGRFRVVQKADVERQGDVYRSDQARPEDWVMLGNHDTPSIWQRATEWCESGDARARAAYLAERLVPEEGERAAFAAQLGASPSALVQALMADLLACEARHVFVYFVDLFGEREPYNRPGVVDEHNWRMRVCPDFERVHRQRRAHGLALDLPAALALALRARGARPDLVTALERGVAI